MFALERTGSLRRNHATPESRTPVDNGRPGRKPCGRREREVGDAGGLENSRSRSVRFGRNSQMRKRRNAFVIVRGGIPKTRGDVRIQSFGMFQNPR